ncbi:MAG: hypothetical protein LPK45_01355, partial [Bacteroidota bacterium]|nr:hypothetical protein [Bacteroidota bacterium]MDX5429682.1 hypothetical protein [Bacteroidota bacterium]MDX5468460.1 hypothetical protein [Bacteroidota bacterium]
MKVIRYRLLFLASAFFMLGASFTDPDPEVLGPTRIEFPGYTLVIYDFVGYYRYEDFRTGEYIT